MTPKQDTVFVRGLEVECIIGLIDWERRIKQKVVIDLELPIDCARAAVSDDVVDTLDYLSVASLVREFVGQSQFKSLARAQITGQTVGMLKLLFQRETLELLGIHCFGANASEIIHIGQAIMSQEGEANSLLYFINTTFNYPTMAEAYRIASMNGLNRVSREHRRFEAKQR